MLKFKMLKKTVAPLAICAAFGAGVGEAKADAQKIANSESMAKCWADAMGSEFDKTLKGKEDLVRKFIFPEDAQGGLDGFYSKVTAVLGDKFDASTAWNSRICAAQTLGIDPLEIPFAGDGSLNDQADIDKIIAHSEFHNKNFDMDVLDSQTGKAMKTMGAQGFVALFGYEPSL